jgi:low temperature requirement protein LtrA
MRSRRRFRPLLGRDPHQVHRASTPLELLFDLTAVVAFAQVSMHVALAVSAGHVAAAAIGLVCTTFAVCWAWINYTWLASAYDTDDGLFRIATLLELIGVLIVAVGVGPFISSLEMGEAPDPGIVVTGYAVMRVTTVFLWLRAAQDDPSHRRTALTYAMLIPTAQVGWITLAVVRPPFGASLGLAAVLIVWELALPTIAEQQDRGTPWHPGHVAERYGLLTIIAIGELLAGTADAAIAALAESRMSLTALWIIGEGAVLAFALWWLYFTLPSAPILRRHRRRAFAWGYLHIALFGAIVSIGAGLHLVALRIEERELVAASEIGLIAGAVGAFALSAFAVRMVLLRTVRGLHVLLFAAAVLLLLIAMTIAAMGAPPLLCGVLVVLSPLVVVVGHELLGRATQEADVRTELESPVRHLGRRARALSE